MASTGPDHQLYSVPDAKGIRSPGADPVAGTWVYRYHRQGHFHRHRLPCPRPRLFASAVSGQRPLLQHPSLALCPERLLGECGGGANQRHDWKLVTHALSFFCRFMTNLIYTGIFTKGGKEIFRSQMVAGYTQVITTFKKGPNGFAIERNTRYLAALPYSALRQPFSPRQSCSTRTEESKPRRSRGALSFSPQRDLALTTCCTHLGLQCD